MTSAKITIKYKIIQINQTFFHGTMRVCVCVCAVFSIRSIGISTRRCPSNKTLLSNKQGDHGDNLIDFIASYCILRRVWAMIHPVENEIVHDNNFLLKKKKLLL